jgi:hypothetical protein
MRIMMTRLGLAPSLLALGAIVLFACGGDDERLPPGAADAAATVDAPATADAIAGDGDAGDNGDAGDDGDAGDGDAGNGDGDAGNGDGDAGNGEEPEPGITCGTDTCDPSVQECCVAQNGMSQECVASGTCQSTTIGCDGPEDCQGNDSCCGTFAAGSVSTGCDAQSSCQFVLCNTSDDCPVSSPMCCSSALFPNASVCSQVCF